MKEAVGFMTHILGVELCAQHSPSHVPAMAWGPNTKGVSGCQHLAAGLFPEGHVPLLGPLYTRTHTHTHTHTHTQHGLQPGHIPRPPAEARESQWACPESQSKSTGQGKAQMRVSTLGSTGKAVGMWPHWAGDRKG